MNQVEHDLAEEAVAKDLIERGLVEQLIQAKPPAPRELTALKEFAESCRDLGITAFPASPWVVAMYLLCMIAEERSATAVTRASAAIDHAHDVHGVAPPGGHSSVKAVLKLNRTHSRKTHKGTRH